MNTGARLEEWCDAIAAALDDDAAASWQKALDAMTDDVEGVLEPGDAQRHLARLRELSERLEAQRALTLDDLDAVVDERRQLVTHSRAVTSYRMAESLAPIERLMRMMWVG
jgi:hypothetical protein